MTNLTFLNNDNLPNFLPGALNSIGVPSRLITTPTLAVFGDSISWQNTKSFPYLYDSGYLTWALGLGKLDYSSILNFGVPGDTTTMMLARLPAVVASTANVVLVMGGTNDAYAGVPLATYNINMTQIYDALRAAGKYVVSISTPPTTAQTAPASKTNLIVEYNRANQAYWANHSVQGVFVDAFANAADSTVANSPWKTGASADTPNVVHPNDLGGYYLGQPLSTALALILPKRQLANSPNDSVSIDANSNNIGLNPCMLGTSGTLTNGTVTGPVANNWNTFGGGSATGVCTKVASPDGVGSAQQIIWTFGALGDFGYFFSDELSANAVAGRYYQADMLIDVSAPTNSTVVDLYYTANYTHTTTTTATVGNSGLAYAVIPVASVASVYVGQAVTYQNTSSLAEIGTIIAINGLNITLDRSTLGITNGTSLTYITESHWGVFDTDRTQSAVPAHQVAAVSPPAIYAPNPGAITLKVWTRLRAVGAGGATVKYSRASLRPVVF